MMKKTVKNWMLNIYLTSVYCIYLLNPKIYYKSRNLKSIPDCLLFETVFKNIFFETVAEQ